MNWWLLLLVVICRGADLVTTFLITPDLRWERNPLIRRLGWRWTLVLNVIACSIAPFFPTFRVRSLRILDPGRALELPNFDASASTRPVNPLLQKIPDPWPFRFRTAEDGNEYLRCIQTGTMPRPEIMIPPTVTENGRVSINPEYRDAPFEMGVFG
jgi:hypothetical protein